MRAIYGSSLLSADGTLTVVVASSARVPDSAMTIGRVAPSISAMRSIQANAVGEA
jgi:hypothetical protein